MRSGLPDAAANDSALRIWIGAGLSAAFCPAWREPVTMTSSSAAVSVAVSVASDADVAVAVSPNALDVQIADAPAHSIVIANLKPSCRALLELMDINGLLRRMSLSLNVVITSRRVLKRR